MSLVHPSPLLIAVDQINNGPPEPSAPLLPVGLAPSEDGLPEPPQAQSQLPGTSSLPPQYENLTEECKRKKLHINLTLYRFTMFHVVNVNMHVAREASRVKCSNCQENTPVCPPPDGHRYVRCNCGCLIVASSSEPTVECHRQACMSTFVLSELNEGRTVQCDDCQGTFHLGIDNDDPITKCRRCRLRSTLWVQKRIKIFSIVASCCIVLGIFATITAVFIQQIVELSDKDSFYVNITYLFASVAVFAGICLSVRTAYYYYVKVPTNRITPITLQSET